MTDTNQVQLGALVPRAPTPAQRRQRQVAPLKGGIYAKAPSGQHVRDRRVQRLTRKLIRLCQWIDPVSDMPLARAWSEAEYVASWAFISLARDGILTPEGTPRRSFDVWRQARQLQTTLGKELGLSPQARTQLRVGNSKAQLFDRSAGGTAEASDINVSDIEARLLAQLGTATAEGDGHLDDGDQGERRHPDDGDGEHGDGEDAGGHV